MKIKFSSKTISTAIIFLLSIVVGLLTVHFVGEGKKEEAISFEEIAQSNEENPEWADISEIEEEVSEEIALTFEQIIQSVNSRYNCSGKITEAVFSDELGIKIDRISYLDGFTPENVSYSLGYIFAGDRIFDKSGNDLTSVLLGYNFIGLRDLNGNALFEKDGKYYFLQNGAVTESNETRYTANEPRYFFESDDSATFYKSNGKWGLKNSEGKIVVSASFTYAYGISEGVAIFATQNKNLYLYDMDGKKISTNYFVPQTGKGIGFVKNNITLASDGSKNIVLKPNGAILETPADYRVVGCSDGMILLEKNGKKGYMGSDGRWKVYPEYSYANDYCEGLAIVSDGKLKVIDKNGETVIPGIFDHIFNFADGVTFAYSFENGWYIIQKQILT